MSGFDDVLNDTSRWTLAGETARRRMSFHDDPLLRELLTDTNLTLTVRTWVPTQDDIDRALMKPQAFAAKQFARINPHWYLNGTEPQ